MIATGVHASPAVTVPAAIATAALLVWYWGRLGAPDVPESRRRIRRSSLVVALMALPVGVRAMSFLDPRTQPAQYVVTWLLVIFCVGLAVVTAVLDMFNTFRLGRARRRAAARRAAGALIRAAGTRRAQEQGR